MEVRTISGTGVGILLIFLGIGCDLQPHPPTEMGVRDSFNGSVIAKECLKMKWAPDDAESVFSNHVIVTRIKIHATDLSQRGEDDYDYFSAMVVCDLHIRFRIEYEKNSKAEKYFGCMLGSEPRKQGERIEVKVELGLDKHKDRWSLSTFRRLSSDTNQYPQPELIP